MNNYFSLTKEQQQKVLQAAENKIGLPGQAIEKDIWVTTIRFEQNEEIRNFAFRCLYNGLMEELENEDEKSNIELLTKKSVDYLLEIGLYNIDKYKNEISEAYKKIMNEENQ